MRLRSALDVRAGDHVGILMPNCVEYAAVPGCALSGVRPVLLNAATDRRLRYGFHSDMRWFHVREA